MQITTLCYIEQEGCYLMLHRTAKKQDPNEGKWIGVGGHLEEGESPEECLLREGEGGDRPYAPALEVPGDCHLRV